MFRKIKTFLYTVTHTTGQLFKLKADLGPFCLSLWVGRDEPSVVRFAVDVEFIYDDYDCSLLDATVEVGVIKVELSLTRSSQE